MTKTTKKTIGYAAVDSGQLLIVDPCYLGSWKDGEADNIKSHYGKACKITLSPHGAGEILVSGIAGNGVVLGTEGDGGFPVKAVYRQDGSILRIEIGPF